MFFKCAEDNCDSAGGEAYVHIHACGMGGIFRTTSDCKIEYRYGRCGDDNDTMTVVVVGVVGVGWWVNDTDKM